ncbi:MAG: glycosyltransferase, partial [Cyanobacteria bacterium REEB65]|nr:glycosyltransferase [Cyanobacteria bacterium REEB65]
YVRAPIGDRSGPPRDPGSSTKGQALNWLWNALPDRQDIDAVAVLDADNVAAPGFFGTMDRELARGFKVVQGLRAAKNPDASHASRLDGLAEALNQQIEAAGRRWWGLSGPLSGSGMAMLTEAFIPLLDSATSSVVEDCEWQLQLLLGGLSIHWTADAFIYDEKIVRFSDIPAQRGRWLRGKVNLCRRYVPRLVAGTLGRKPGTAESLLYLLVVLPRSVLAVGLLAGTVLATARAPVPGLADSRCWYAAVGAMALYLAGSLAIVRPGRAFWKSVPHLPGFMLTLLAAFFLALFRRTTWIATPHRGGGSPHST